MCFLLWTHLNFCGREKMHFFPYWTAAPVARKPVEFSIQSKSCLCCTSLWMKASALWNCRIEGKLYYELWINFLSVVHSPDSRSRDGQNTTCFLGCYDSVDVSTSSLEDVWLWPLQGGRTAESPPSNVCLCNTSRMIRQRNRRRRHICSPNLICPRTHTHTHVWMEVSK